MNSHNLSLSLVLYLAAVGSAAVYGCSSGDNNNPGPSSHDGGNDSTGSSGSSSSGSSSGSGSGSGSGSSSGSSSGSACTSDASTCNSCATPSQDPYNACSQYTTNCIPFQKSRVPTHPSVP